MGSHEASDDRQQVHRWWHSPGVGITLAFVAGLVVSLALLGTIAAIIGRVLTQWIVAFAMGTAMLSLLAGIAVLMAPAIRRRVPDARIRQQRGAAGAFLYGLFYSLATLTTSAGPLFLLLTIAAAIGNPAYGALLSVSYAIGRGLPFLFLGLFAGAGGRVLSRVSEYQRPAEVISGVALVGLSIYFVWLAQRIA